jgi:hypothetical protein
VLLFVHYQPGTSFLKKAGNFPGLRLKRVPVPSALPTKGNAVNSY